MRILVSNLLIRFLYFFVRQIVHSENLPEFNKILILAPHPDDEIFGAGGLMLQLLEKGCRIHIIYLTDGEASGVWPDLDEIKRQRVELSEKICKSLGISLSNISRLHLSDGNIPRVGQSGFEEAVGNIKRLIDMFEPDAVFATHTLDYWPFDHVACANIATEAVNQSEHKTQLWYYWVWAWYNIRPWQIFKINYSKTIRINIKDQIPEKKVLMDIYIKSVNPEGKPWSGILPQPLLKALIFPFEVIERSDTYF